jgi:hypothetical protein
VTEGHQALRAVYRVIHARSSLILRSGMRR